MQLHSQVSSHAQFRLFPKQNCYEVEASTKHQACGEGLVLLFHLALLSASPVTSINEPPKVTSHHRRKQVRQQEGSPSPCWLWEEKELDRQVHWLSSFPRNHHSRSSDEAESHHCLGKAENSCKLGPISQQNSLCGSVGPELGRHLPYQRILRTSALVCCLKVI